MTDKEKSPSEKPAEKKPDAEAAVARADAAAAAAGLTAEDVQAAFDASGAPSHPVEDLQARVARLEAVVFGDLNAHFGGKIAALANPASLPGEDAED